MLSGAGSPLIDILTGAPKGGTGGSRFDLLSTTEQSRTRQTVSGVNDAASIIADLVQLSEQAQDSLEKGYDALKEAAGRDAGTDLLRQRVAQVKEEVEFITNLLQEGATPEQARILGKQIDELGRNLKQIGRQLGLPDGTQAVTAESSITVEAISLSYTFNQVAQVQREDGSKAEISTSLSIQLDIVSITAENSIAAVQTGPGGQDESSASAVTSDYEVANHSFKKLLAEFEKNFFTDRERLPLSLYNTIRNMIEKAVKTDEGRGPNVNRTV